MNLSIVYGLHAATAALDYAPEAIHQVWLDAGRQDQRLNALKTRLEQHGLTAEQVGRKQLDKLAGSSHHQGVVLKMALPTLLSEAELLARLDITESQGFYLVLDQVQDPHNLGACLRTADACGVNGVIIPKNQAVGLTPTVCKVASGAAATMPVYQVTNLARTLDKLKQHGLWLIGAAGEAEQSVYQVDLTVPVALVLGAEGKGLRRLTREQCDMLVKLPMAGQVSSLNLSVAAGVLMYETVRQRQVSL
ncbi:MAG: 23S rRNA (guanosine(2251)-2'-O)-methyltransferase RlmB [Methylococcales bacterium]|nr:23S rRNA (guanosine(2251)-2'-O)-methyltransferase RlmB [Methylococcales bacterium]